MPKYLVTDGTRRRQHLASETAKRGEIHLSQHRAQDRTWHAAPTSPDKLEQWRRLRRDPREAPRSLQLRVFPETATS